MYAFVCVCDLLKIKFESLIPCRFINQITFVAIYYFDCVLFSLALMVAKWYTSILTVDKMCVCIIQFASSR